MPPWLHAIKLIGGYPHPSTGFKGTVAGFHFPGAPPARNFGSLTRFGRHQRLCVRSRQCGSGPIARGSGGTRATEILH